MSPLIIETDIGHDPDDYFALCYLHSAGYNIKAILISVGHPYQIAITKMFCDQVGLDIPIGVARIEKLDGKEPFYDFHHKLLKRYGYPHEAQASELGKDVLKAVMQENPESEVFICGPPKSVGACVIENPDIRLPKVTFQGGFLGYHLHNFQVDKLDKFIGKTTVPTYNLGGAKKESLAIIDGNVGSIRFISKNVCHTVLYDRERHAFMKELPTKNRADELFIEGMDVYLEKHSEKKFHDPTAACCMKHPEIAKWVRGKMYNAKGEWGTIPNETANSETIAAIDYDLLWSLIRSRE